MLRPPSIIRYERLYLLSFALSVATSIVSWPTRAALLAARPQLATMQWMLPATFVASMAIGVLLWFFTARSPSRAARWAVLVFAILSVLGILMNLLGLSRGTTPVAAAIASVTSSALFIAATTLLFRGDARDWFGDDAAIEEMP